MVCSCCCCVRSEYRLHLRPILVYVASLRGFFRANSSRLQSRCNLHVVCVHSDIFLGFCLLDAIRTNLHTWCPLKVAVQTQVSPKNGFLDVSAILWRDKRPGHGHLEECPPHSFIYDISSISATQLVLGAPVWTSSSYTLLATFRVSLNDKWLMMQWQNIF